MNWLLLACIILLVVWCLRLDMRIADQDAQILLIVKGQAKLSELGITHLKLFLRYIEENKSE